MYRLVFLSVSIAVIAACGGDEGEPLSLESVVVSGIATTIEIAPGTSKYVVDLAVSQASVTVIVTLATPGDRLIIAGSDVASGEPSEPIALDLGNNEVDIVVENDADGQRTYRLILRRAAQIAQYAYVKASNAEAMDLFGGSIAVSGDTIAVGANDEGSAATGVDGDQDDNGAPGSGAVYVFRRVGASWKQEAYIKASNTEGVEPRIDVNGDGFGGSVALSGDTLAVGAIGEDSAAAGVNGAQDDQSARSSGAVYVFRRTGGTWEQEAYIKASNPDPSDFFGISVALAGDTLAVGASNEDSDARGIDGDQGDNTLRDSGAVYVFRRNRESWEQEAYIKASNAGEADGFGQNIALSGDVLAVGAMGENSAATGVNGDQADSSADESGAVYVFRRTRTTWQQEAYVKASNAEAGDWFSYSVALSGDTLAVGALQEASRGRGIDSAQSDNSAPYAGAVYVFRHDGTAWEQEAYIKASDTKNYDKFGSSVALHGDTLVVGAEAEDSAGSGINPDPESYGNPGTGAVYLFRRTDAAWRQDVFIKASNSGVAADFGLQVALSDDTVVVGTYLEDSTAKGINGDQFAQSAPYSGAVYIFH